MMFGAETLTKKGVIQHDTTTLIRPEILRNGQVTSPTFEISTSWLALFTVRPFTWWAVASSPEKPRQTVPTSTGNWQCLGEHTWSFYEFFTFFFCKCRSGSWGFLRYLEIPEEERTHIWFNQKQVQKTKHHCSGTVVADTSWPSPATASARAKGLFESANVSYLDMTMENHHFFKGKASINRLFSIARVSSPRPTITFISRNGWFGTSPPPFLETKPCYPTI